MWKYILLLASVTFIHGCGNSAGSSVQKQPTKAAIKLFTQGALPQSTSIAGIGITIDLPPGLTIMTDAGGNVGSGVIIGSGNTSSKVVVISSGFIPATAVAPAALSFVLASTDPAGFGTGEFATVNFNISNGSYPKGTDFSISDFRVIDINGVTITGLSPTFTADIG